MEKKTLWAASELPEAREVAAADELLKSVKPSESKLFEPSARLMSKERVGSKKEPSKEARRVSKESATIDQLFNHVKLSRFDEFGICDPCVRSGSKEKVSSMDSFPEESADNFDDNLYFSCPADDLVYACATGIGTNDALYGQVCCYLAVLIDGFSDLDFQSDLQKLLMNARRAKGQLQHSRGSQKVVPGRLQLCEQIEGLALIASGMCGTAVCPEVGAWKSIARFVHEETIIDQLAVIDELLALPPNSYYKAVLDCANN